MNSVFLGFFIVFQVLTIQCKSQPDWTYREPDVWVENGIIYSRGSCAKLATETLTMVTAETRARGNISRALAMGEISGYSSIPAENDNRSEFNYNGIKGELGLTIIKENFFTKNDTGYVLISCIGAKLYAEPHEEDL